MLPLLLAAVLAAGCEYSPHAAVGESSTGGLLVGYLRSCGDKISTVELDEILPVATDPAAGIVRPVPLWRIAATSPVTIREITVGDTPTGFATVVPLHLPLPTGAQFALSFIPASGASAFDSTAWFQLHQLRPGKVYWGGEAVALKAFLRDSRCSNSLMPLDFLRPVFRVGLMFGTATVVIVAIVLVVIVVKRRRRRPQRRPPSPGWHPDPAGEAIWRWWDGQGWTVHTAGASELGHNLDAT